MWVKYIKPYRFQALTGFIFKMIEAFFELLVPLVVADIIDNGIAHQDQAYIWKMGGVLFLLAITGYCCALICHTLLQRHRKVLEHIYVMICMCLSISMIMKILMK